MSCTNCYSHFGLLKKEVGCEICGFSFCSKCCCKKLLVLGTGENVKKLVCNKCFESLASDKKPAAYSPPSAHKKRMATLGNRSLSLGGATTSSWSNEKDKAIAERLQKLKREMNKEVHPSQGEIEERLAKLKGMDPAKYTAPPIMVYRPADKRSSIEQAEDLMKQLAEESRLDAKRPKPEDEIAARLAKLRGEPPPTHPSHEEVQAAEFVGVGSVKQLEEVDIAEELKHATDAYKAMLNDVSKETVLIMNTKEYKEALEQMNKEQEKGEDEDIDEEEETDKIVQQMMAVKMDSSEMDDPESLNGANLHSLEDTDNKNGSDEEFPWCVICTEDAKIRCFGCDSDLYCMSCFRDCHDSLDIKDHKTCPFLSPKKM